ncbi:MAG: response regulator [Gammaproteobacteria bacterium]|nr:response regulator [Gammaproteobacteria bacterium]
MMPGKRALVVDDSRSARVVLSRMLERYGIVVDSADSAESALEYLKNRHPAVIFMDHLMPGMDGLQAVREIKANPELAGIPIMMYTSQEGEIYCGQARASGAVGVLPKSIRPIDVTKALYQLKLLPDRRDGEPSGLEAIGAPSPATAVAAPVPAETPAAASVEALLREQNLELRKFVVASLDSVVRRVVAELHQKDAVRVEGEEAGRVPAASPKTPWAQWLAGCAALAALAALAVLYWQARIEADQARAGRTGAHRVERHAHQGDREVAHRGRDVRRRGGAGGFPPARARGPVRRAGAQRHAAGVRWHARGAVRAGGDQRHRAYRELRRQLLPRERGTRWLHARAAGFARRAMRADRESLR